MGLAGQTLATAYTNRARVLGLFDATKARNVLHIIDPTNGIGVITYASVADAQTGNAASAQNLYNNYFLLYVVAAQEPASPRSSLRRSSHGPTSTSEREISGGIAVTTITRC
ncbi:hypothetical protein ABID65_008531 [Bradyrhizobium sp. S3.9.2]|uniref:hypothetical protein n=1 Tax=Bradyrhizobium sp. S3.9.2 TaxID=3156432 RepID=UPI0033907E48